MIKMIMALGRSNELGSSTTPDGLPWGRSNELGSSTTPDGLPWERNLEDMKYFRDQTLGNVVVYGGNTFRQFQKMGMEFGLPDRDNYVISSPITNPMEIKRGDVAKVSLEWLVNGFRPLKGFWIIGGKSIYDQLHPYAEEVHLTRINQDYPDADVYLDTSWLCDFEKVKVLSLNDYSCVEIYKRKGNRNET